MSLDLFQGDQQEALSDASQRIAPDLPAMFEERYDASQANAIEWHNSAAYQFAKEHALTDYIDDVKMRTGETLPNPGYLVGGGSLDDFNAAQDRINEKYPVNLSPLSPENVDAMTLARMKRAHDRETAMQSRESTWGGTLGGILGGLVGGISDPVTLATLPLGGAGELSVGARALEFGAIGGGTEAAVSALSYRTRERAVPGSSAEIPGSIANAAMFGFGLGGFFGTLGKLLGSGARWLPTSVRDDVNVATSRAQQAAVNPFPTPAGEVAAEGAVRDGIEQAVRGEPVTVGTKFDPAHVRDLTESAGVKSADELAPIVERQQRPLTYDEVPDIEAHEAIPGPVDETFSYWEHRLSTATPEERAALEANGDISVGSTVRSANLPADVPDGLFRGSGRNDIAAGYNGTAVPILGEGKYFAFDESAAKEFGPNVERGHVGEIGSNPLVITDGKQWQALTRRAGWETPNPFGRTAEQVKTQTDKLRSIIEADGHDGVVVWWDDKVPRDIGPNGENLKLLRNVFGTPQAISYKSAESAAAHVRAPEPIVARDMTPQEIEKLSNDPKIYDVAQHDLEHVLAANPAAEYSTQIRLPDGSYRLDTRPLKDVLAELNDMETAGEELLACATGELGMAAE